MAEFRNGMRDPYGIEAPDPDQDTYQASAPSIQQGWTSQVNGPAPTVPASAPGTQGPSTYAPVSAQREQLRSMHSTPPPEQKDPGVGYYVLKAIAQAVTAKHPAFGAIAGGLAAKGDQTLAKNRVARQQYEDQQANEERQFRMTPEVKPPTADQLNQRDEAQILADPEVQKYRAQSGLPTTHLNPGELQAGKLKQTTEAVEGVKRPGRLEEIQARADAKAQPQVSREVKTTASGETVTYDPKGNTWLDSRGRPMASAPKLGSIAGGGAAGNAESDIHITAKALVDANNGDPTAVSTLKQLGGFGNKKMQIFAEARRIDPTFNASKGDRMAKTVENFTTSTVSGGGNMQLRSIGTFAQHAVGVQEAVKEIGRSDNQILNRPISWIQQQSDPKYTAFQAALLAPTMEYLRLLNNGGAPYEQERQQAEQILSKYSTVKQAVAATQEMGKVVAARANSLNAEFKRGTGGHDLWKTLPDALPPEAFAAMAQLGHPISGGQAPQASGQTPQAGTRPPLSAFEQQP